MTSLALTVLGAGRVLAMHAAMPQLAKGAHACSDAMTFLRTTAGEDEPVIASIPWYTAWQTERPVVNAPTNGAIAFLVVARHYGARWILEGMPSYGSADISRARARLR